MPTSSNWRKALSKLSRRAPGPDDYKVYVDDIIAEKNDRGAAVLLTALVEANLQYCLERVLHNLEETEYHAFFEAADGVASTFADKISLASALGIISEKTRRSLADVKAVRNAFSHSRIAISFQTLEVIEAVESMEDIPFIVSGLMTPPILIYPPDVIMSPARMKFQGITSALSHNLYVWAYRATQSL